MTLLNTPDHLWLVEIVVGLAVLVIANYVIKKLLKKVKLRSLAGLSKWHKNLDYIFYTPINILFWILGLTLVIQTLEKRFDFSFFGPYISPFRNTALVIAIGWVCMRWKTITQKRLLTQDLQAKKLDVGLVQVFSKLLSLLIFIISGMIILEIWDLNITPLLAVGGIGAGAIAFSAKDVLGNVFGGMMLHINRPFIVGDFISVPSLQIEAFVEEIGWNITSLRDRHKRPLYLPNAAFSSALVMNYSRITHRRIYETISVHYKDFDKLKTLIPQIQSALEKHPDIDHYLPVLLVLSNFGEYSINLLLDVYSLKTRYDEFLRSKSAILAVIYEELIKEGMEIAGPAMRLSGSVHTS